MKVKVGLAALASGIMAVLVGMPLALLYVVVHEDDWSDA